MNKAHISFTTQIFHCCNPKPDPDPDPDPNPNPNSKSKW